MNLSIIQFDSDPFYRRLLELMLYPVGIKPTDSAGNREHVARVLAGIESGKIPQVDAVVIEHQHWHLSPMPEELVAKIRAKNPNVKIISYSADPDKPSWADYLAVKSNLDPEHTLRKVIETHLGIQLGGSESDPENN